MKGTLKKLTAALLCTVLLFTSVGMEQIAYAAAETPVSGEETGRSIPEEELEGQTEESIPEESDPAQNDKENLPETEKTEQPAEEKPLSAGAEEPAD